MVLSLDKGREGGREGRREGGREGGREGEGGREEHSVRELHALPYFFPGVLSGLSRRPPPHN